MLSTEGKLAFSVATTSGSLPVVLRQAASEFEDAKYEIGAMVMSRMKRLLVICDMHGDDLREILGASSLGKVNIHDGRAVMREALLAEFNRLNRDIQRRLDQVAPNV